jgi:hypothetical protein
LYFFIIYIRDEIESKIWPDRAYDITLVLMGILYILMYLLISKTVKRAYDAHNR